MNCVAYPLIFCGRMGRAAIGWSFRILILRPAGAAGPGNFSSRTVLSCPFLPCRSRAAFSPMPSSQVEKPESQRKRARPLQTRIHVSCTTSSASASVRPSRRWTNPSSRGVCRWYSSRKATWSPWSRTAAASCLSVPSIAERILTSPLSGSYVRKGWLISRGPLGAVPPGSRHRFRSSRLAI